jgi:hypothetical protein
MIRRPAWFVAHLTTTCALGLLVCLYALAPEPIRVEVDLAASAGGRIELFLNDLSRPPLGRPLVPGERRRYVFDGIAEDITLLRIDPTDTSGAMVEIFSVVVSGRQGRLAEFGPQALAGWSSSGVAAVGVDAGALRLRAMTSDPIIITRTAISARQGGAWRRWLPLVNVADIGWRLAAVSLLLLVVAGSFDRARRLHLPLAAAAVALTAGVIALVGRLPDGPGSAAVAVSRATFVGLSMRPVMLASALVVVGAVAIGVSAGLLGRRRTRTAVADGGSPVEPIGRKGMIVGVGLLAILTAPGLEAVAIGTTTQAFTPHWDADNLLYWSYLVHGGALPYRTFWYPYGGLFVFDLPLPLGPAIRWLYNLTLFGTFFAALGRWRGVGNATLATGLLVLAARFDLLPGIERYLLGVNVVLSWVAIDPGHGRAAARAPFWVACATAMLADPPQLFYAGLPVGLMLGLEAVEIWRNDPGWRRTLLRRTSLDLGVPAVLAALYTLVLTGSGQLGGFWSFYGRLSDSVAYSAWPVGLPGSLANARDAHQFFLFVFSAVLVALGTAHWMAGGSTRPYGQALAGLGIVVLLITQKASVRWIFDQSLVALCAGVLVLGLGWPGRRRTIDWVVAGLLLGAFGATVMARPSAGSVLLDVLSSPRRAVSDLGLLVAGGETMRRANAVRFAPERFAKFPAERQIVERMRAHAGPRGDVRLFAVTDDPVLYVLSGQPPVWMANLYNASPVYEQARVVRWLEETSPPYAVLNRDRLGFDSFQVMVRVPLLFASVVDGYVPLASLGRIDVLRRRGPDEPAALSYWRDALGADVDMGRLASVSSFGRAPSCERSCADLLEVSVSGAAGEGAVRVPLSVGGLPFSVTFTRVRNEAVYHVLLDRVWFWRAAAHLKLPRALGAPADPGVTLRIRRVLARDDVLY